MAIISVFQILSVIVFSLFICGLLNNLWSDTENSCEMTYMFEYPQFVRIKVPNNEQFPQYGLYAYSEGRLTEKARKMRFDGVPVLFLPGNVGSYKQVRSLASVALRKALESSKYNFHFDYFSIDYNDEKSGLFGGVLERQGLFATYCIEAILDLYNTNGRFSENQPKSVIVIGHSMGGIVARSLLVNPQNRNVISLILTLASPHKHPVLNSDYHFERFYKNIDDYWKLKTLNISNIAPNIWSSKVFISIGGGVRDLMVPSALIYSKHSDINVLTTSIPGVWLSTDHLCIMWCKQLMLVMNRFLFSIVNPSTRQLNDDPLHIARMGHHYFKIGESRNITHYNNPVEFIPDSNWHEDSRRTYFMSHNKGVTKTWYYMIRLIDALHHEKVSFEIVDVEDKDWIFGCQAKYVHGQYRICLNGRHLSKYSQWTPSKNGKRRTATLDLKALRMSYPHWTHVLLKVSPTFKPVKVSVDIYNEATRTIQAKLPSMFSFGRKTIIQETHLNALMYNLTFSGLEMLYQAFVLFVEPVNCNGAKTHQASAKMYIPWAKGHELYSVFTDTEISPMRLRLLHGNPKLKNSTQQVHVVLNLDPQCTYSVHITPSLYDSLGQLSRHYATSLPAYVAAVSLLVLRHWAASMEPSAPTNLGSSFHSALCGDYTKPYYLLLSARMGIMVFVSVPFLARLAPSLNIGAATSQNFLLLPLFLYIVALGMMHILGAGVWCLLIFSGQIAHKVIFRLIAVGRGGGIKLWDWAANALTKAPGAGGTLLVALATGSCGAVALVGGAAFYFFLLTKMYEDYLEDLVYKTIKKVAKKLGVKKPEKMLNKLKRGSKSTEKETDNKLEQPVPSSSKADRAANKDKSETEMSGDAETVKESDELSREDSQEEANQAGDRDARKPLQSSESIDSDEDAEIPGDANRVKSDAETQMQTVESQALQVTNSTSNETEDTSQPPNNSSEDEDFSLLSLHFHFAMFFLWCLITLLNVPALLTWAHNYKYNKVLEPDPSYIPGIIMCASAALLWQIEAPKKNVKYYDVLQRVIYIASVVVLIATPMALYRLNYLLPCIFAAITLHQTFPRGIEELASPTENDDDSPSPPTDIKEKLQNVTEEETANFSHILKEEFSELNKINLLKEKLEAAEAE